MVFSRNDEDGHVQDEIDYAVLQETHADVILTLYDQARRIRPSMKMDFPQGAEITQLPGHLERLADPMGDCTVIISCTVLTMLQQAKMVTMDDQPEYALMRSAGKIGRHTVVIDQYAGSFAPIIIAAPKWVRFSEDSRITVGDRSEAYGEKGFNFRTDIWPFIDPSCVKTIDVDFAVLCDPDYRKPYRGEVDY